MQTWTSKAAGYCIKLQRQGYKKQCVTDIANMKIAIQLIGVGLAHTYPNHKVFTQASHYNLRSHSFM